MRRAPAKAACEEVFTFMRRHNLNADDLTEMGGQDLRSPSQRAVKKVKNVEKCWEKMAQLGVTHEQLFPDFVPRDVPGFRGSTRRGKGV